MTKYPNLVELLRYYPCGTPAVCDHAEIEPELLEAVLDGTEELMPVEIMRLSRLYECPVGVLNHPEVIMLDMGRMKHQRMMKEIVSIHTQLQTMAAGGTQKAKEYLDLDRWSYQNFLRAIYENKLSYCHYLGKKEELQHYVRWSEPEPRRRGLRRKAQA